MSPLGSGSQAVTLLADINRPGSQEDLVSNWEPAVSGAEIALCLLALAVASLPLPPEMGWAGPQLASSPLVFAQSFVL